MNLYLTIENGGQTEKIDLVPTPESVAVLRAAALSYQESSVKAIEVCKAAIDAGNVITLSTMASFAQKASQAFDRLDLLADQIEEALKPAEPEQEVAA